MNQIEYAEPKLLKLTFWTLSFEPNLRDKIYQKRSTTTSWAELELSSGRDSKTGKIHVWWIFIWILLNFVVCSVQNNFKEKKIGSKTFLGQKNFGLKFFLVQQILCPKNLAPKKYWVQKNFWSTIFGPKVIEPNIETKNWNPILTPILNPMLNPNIEPNIEPNIDRHNIETQYWPQYWNQCWTPNIEPIIEPQ